MRLSERKTRLATARSRAAASRFLSILLLLLSYLLLETTARGESQAFAGKVSPGQTLEFVVSTDAPGPINYTVSWANKAAITSAIYPPGSDLPDARGSGASPQAVSDITTIVGTFTVRVSLPAGDKAGPTPFDLVINYPTLATDAFVGNERRYDPEIPPNKWGFRPSDTPSPVFEVRGGNLAFVDYSVDGGQTYTAIPATYVVNAGINDVVTASIPAQPANKSVAYRTRAVAPDGIEVRRNRPVIYIVSDLPRSLAEVEDNPRFYKNETARPSPNDWRDQSVYMLIPDRFFNGDTTNDRLGFANFSLSNGRTMHGGDWAGLTSKLDYLQSLGITTIWVTPILQNFEAYHGYAAVDFFLPARQSGTLDEFRNFVDEAHARNMYVLMDITCNHGGILIENTDGNEWRYPGTHSTSFLYDSRPEFEKPFFYPLEFRDLDLFHAHGNIDAGHFDDQGQNPSRAELGQLSGLNDFKTERSDVRAALKKIFKWWIANTDIDGFRLDAVKHVERSFWRSEGSESFAEAIKSYARSIGKNNFFLTGEFVTGNDWRLSGYTGPQDRGLDSLLYYPMYYTIQSVFKGGGATSQIDGRYSERNRCGPQMNQPCYLNPNLLLSFVDNHDNNRFLNNAGPNGVSKLKLALAFIHTSRGIPTLYYGTEQGFFGAQGGCTGGDCNREDMFANPSWNGNAGHSGDNFNTSSDLFQYVSRLNQIRAANIALRRGSQQQRWNNPTGAGYYIYTRTYQSTMENQEVLVVLNTSGSSQTGATPQVTPSIIPAGTWLRDELDPTYRVQTYDDGMGRVRVRVDAGPYAVRILKPE